MMSTCGTTAATISLTGVIKETVSAAAVANFRAKEGRTGFSAALLTSKSSSSFGAKVFKELGKNVGLVVQVVVQVVKGEGCRVACKGVG